MACKRTHRNERRHETSQEHQAQRVREAKAYRTACLLRQTKLESPFPEEAMRGVEGILLAHKKLLEQDAFGLLIGGMATESYKANVEGFKNHKDVDVLVLTPNFKIRPYQNGIDWWLPKKDREGFYKYSSAGGIILNYSMPVLRTKLRGICIPAENSIGAMKRMDALRILDKMNLSEEEYVAALDEYENDVVGGIYPEDQFFDKSAEPLEEYLEQIGYKTASESSPHDSQIRNFTTQDLRETMREIREISGKEDVVSSINFEEGSFILPIRDARIPSVLRYQGEPTNRFYAALIEKIRGGSPREVEAALKLLERHYDK